MAQTSIGQRLRQAREAIPASLAEASRATRVRVDFLEAMERDSFTFISGRVYIVGMLRYDTRKEGSLRIGDRAPDAVLRLPDGRGTTRLSDHIGGKPLVLVFGSFT